METYTTTTGEVLTYDASPDELRYLAQAFELANDPDVSLGTFIEYVWNKENPTLDATIVPGRGMVTKAVLERAIYHVYHDLFQTKRIQQGLAAPIADDYAMTVSEVADVFNVQPSSIIKAINVGRLKAKKNGKSWLISAKSVKEFRPRGKNDQD
jgi:excisionase family DNA binding protein